MPTSASTLPTRQDAVASRTAVVIGAGVGGLLAAAALHESFPRVVVVDRDTLPDGARARRGVPQGRQLHALLASGALALDQLLPGLTGELRAAGASVVDLQQDVHWYLDGHLMRGAASGLTGLGSSRPLLEHVVRQRVRALPGVEVVDACEVTGLVTTHDRASVVGVRVRPRDPSRPEFELDAGLVVDSAGRGSRTPVWLEELGYPRAPETTVRTDHVYVTRHYHQEPEMEGEHLTAASTAFPGQPRSGVVSREEGGRFTVALTGMLGQEPPTDDAGMLAYAESLSGPEVAEVMRRARPLDEPVRMRYPGATRRHYERLRRFPGRYLVMNDGICSFNPVYGQGMTVAALEAVLLRRLLAAGEQDLARRFFRAAGKLVDAPWALATGSDLRFAEVAGRRPLGSALVDRYLDRFRVAATVDPRLGEAFLRVANMLDAPGGLFAPGTVLRVLRSGGRPRAAAAR